MSIHTFTLVLSAENTDQASLEDLVFEAGCDDALLLHRDGIPFLNFDREAEGLMDAILVAIAEVHRAGPGIEVLRVEPDDLVTAADIAHRTGRTKESIRLLIGGQRGQGGFPAPVRGIDQRTRLWRWAEVVPWLARHGALANPSESVEEANTIAAVNAALQLQRLGAGQTTALLERLAG